MSKFSCRTCEIVLAGFAEVFMKFRDVKFSTKIKVKRTSSIQIDRSLRHEDPKKKRKKKL